MDKLLGASRRASSELDFGSLGYKLKGVLSRRRSLRAILEDISFLKEHEEVFIKYRHEFPIPEYTKYTIEGISEDICRKCNKLIDYDNATNKLEIDAAGADFYEVANKVYEFYCTLMYMEDDIIRLHAELAEEFPNIELIEYYVSNVYYEKFESLIVNNSDKNTHRDMQMLIVNEVLPLGEAVKYIIPEDAHLRIFALMDEEHQKHALNAVSCICRYGFFSSEGTRLLNLRLTVIGKYYDIFVKHMNYLFTNTEKPIEHVVQAALDYYGNVGEEKIVKQFMEDTDDLSYDEMSYSKNTIVCGFVWLQAAHTYKYFDNNLVEVLKTIGK